MMEMMDMTDIMNMTEIIDMTDTMDMSAYYRADKRLLPILLISGPHDML